MERRNSFILLASFLKIFGLAFGATNDRLLVVTVATEETDGYQRFMRSARINDIDVQVFGLHQEWLGGDLANGPGGGHKLNLLRTGLRKYKDDENLVSSFFFVSCIRGIFLSTCCTPTGFFIRNIGSIKISPF